MPLCKVLQTVDCDLALACDQVATVVQTVVGLREDADSSFDSLYSKIEDFARDLKIELTFPRVGRRRNDHYDIGSPKEAYRASIYIPFMDYFMSELKERFTVHRTILTTLSGFIPANLDKRNLSDAEISENTDIYSDLLPEPDALSHELKLWKTKWQNVNNKERPVSALAALDTCNADFFPNISRLLTIVATWPVSTATPERTFSTLRRLKTWLRNATGEERLTGLALLSVHRDVAIDTDTVIDMFATQKTRRIDFVL